VLFFAVKKIYDNIAVTMCLQGEFWSRVPSVPNTDTTWQGMENSAYDNQGTFLFSVCYCVSYALCI